MVHEQVITSESSGTYIGSVRRKENLSFVTCSLSYAIYCYGYKSSWLRPYCSLYGLPFAQTHIYTSLLAPLWWQVESPVSFPETETLLPTPLFPYLPVGLLSGTQSATLSWL
jgi:hypothetical protein